MKYQIRKAETITVYRATKAITLDDKRFRKLEDNPYTGNSEEEFLEYIAGLDFNDLPYDLCSEQADLLAELSESEMEEYGSSLDKCSDIWIQIGEEDPEYRKTGGFDVRGETQYNY